MVILMFKLFKMRESQEREITEMQKLTYTKRMVTALLIIGLIDLQFTYLLSFLGRESVQDLSIAIVTYILGVAIAYMVKSFFGKKEEEKTRLEEKELDFNLEQLMNDNTAEEGSEENSEEVVG